ncbi:hypothetical protein ASD97_24920 [Streptomyces sp. Root63]|uniref:DUF6221 family protein n=1 Tax=unclassified Streptomyces TaxID=2593676 RepID=UPI0006F70AC8|nr:MULTISPECIES: DUF6221 family protein [unclassified Streptomyces]KQX27546.1 hypothetical protein ASD29_30150 [Streptomyces sp. Root1295]KRA34786.1 hypothetical protein ASD97_24920 [Streptomyces sp. Root63]
MTDLADFLRARIAERRAIADTIHDLGCGEIRYDATCTCGQPAFAEADLDAKLALFEDLLAEGHERNEEDHWYSCAALTDEDGNALCFDESRAPGPCDCGRDARINRRLRILARPFAGHASYQEDWAA